jgi:lysophosphatidylcholine acyltransferase/lyso-PAF acetyltransferase
MCGLCCVAIVTKTMRTIYVKRDDPNSKTKAAEEIHRRATSGGVWPKVLIFPEG